MILLPYELFSVVCINDSHFFRVTPILAPDNIPSSASIFPFLATDRHSLPLFFHRNDINIWLYPFGTWSETHFHTQLHFCLQSGGTNKAIFV